MNSYSTLSSEPIIQIGINTILSTQGDYKLQKNYSCAQALLLDEEAMYTNLFLITTRFNDMGFFDFITRLRRINMHAKIVVISHIIYSSFIKKIFKLGSNGILPIYATQSEIIRMLHQLNQKDKIISDSILANITSEIFSSQNDILEKLSSREIEIMMLLLEGFSVTDIASKLILSPKTISTHKKSIYKKLNVTNLIDLHLFIDFNKLKISS